LTRAITIIALICFLVVGATTASILGRDSVPAAGPEMAAASAALQRPILNQGAVSNRESKGDRLTIAAVAPASFEPPPTAAIPGATPSEPLRQAFAATPSADIEGLRITDPAPSAAAPKPKLVNKPAAQKSYALLSDAQIAGIKERLKLSSYQESYWPAVETALRAVARKIQAARQADPTATGVPIDPDAEEVQQLKSAAMPLLFQLREDQKREVRTLARLIGLEKVAAQI
jgi:hypothetical protein